MVQHRQQIILVVVPLQAKNLRQRVHFGDGQLGQQTKQILKTHERHSILLHFSLFLRFTAIIFGVV